MEIVTTIACILTFVIPTIMVIIGIRKEKNKRLDERDKMFREDEIKFKKKQKAKPESIDAVEVLSNILQDEVKKITESPVKPKLKTGRKPGKKKPEFPIEPNGTVKYKSKRGRKPKNNDKKGGDQMLLS
jgi:hypothetical protein